MTGRVMGDADMFDPDDVRLMQGLAQEVTALRPELVNTCAGVGQLAWIWGMGRRGEDDNWRRRLWYQGTDLIGWGWANLPYVGSRGDGQSYRVDYADLAWQVHPDRPEILDEILGWYGDQAGPAEHRTGVRAADADGQRRLAAHGYLPDENQTPATGSWEQANVRDLAELEEPVLPDGFRFRTAGEVGAEAAWRAHVDAWHPSTLTLSGLRGTQGTWPYRHDLHVLAQAPDGTLAATVHRARAAGASQMTVSCLGAEVHRAAKGLYYSLGFREYTRDLPYKRPS